jgi:polyisoprenoid-binding protein YceI
MSTNWKLDPTHSGVHFSVRHLMVSKVRGSFKAYEVDLAFDPKNPEAGKVDVSVDVASIDTKEEKRDGHLKSADFFDVEKYPRMTFKSARVEVKDASNYLVHGDLSIHGVTKPVTLDVEFAGEAKDPWGNSKAGFSAHTSISRKDFGLEWNQALETGGVLVGDKVEISIDLELVKG